MDEVHEITDIAQLKAISDPFRHKILLALCHDFTTTKAIAEHLDEKPSRLYHHVDVLEEAGLIRVVETRQVRGAVEKTYEPVARRFRVDHRLFEDAENKGELATEAHAMIEQGLHQAIAEVHNHQHDAEESTSAMFVRLSGLKLTADQVGSLQTNIHEWLEACQAEEPGDDDEAETYGLTVLLHPISGEGAAAGPGGGIKMVVKRVVEE